jgi:ACR3 family arsenite efflux pump ArsB
MHKKLWSENLKENPCIDESVDWIHLAQGKEELQALVKVIMNFLVP